MHTHLVARKLALLGHDVTMFAAHASDHALNVVSVCAPTAGLSGRREWQVENDAYREIVERIAAADFDVVHNNSLHPVPLAYASTLPPMMTVLHTPPFSPLVDQARQTACRFVAVSQSVADQWREHIRVSDIVANGIELDLFAAVSASARPPRAIWYGRIVPEKGLHLAIDAARLASLEIDVAGPIIDRDYWAQMIAPRCGSDVHYLGHLDHVTLRGHISRAGVVLVTPRWEEPFGLVAAEALACGTPVAAFRRGALPDVIGDAGVLADRDDPVDLARAGPPRARNRRVAVPTSRGRRSRLHGDDRALRCHLSCSGDKAGWHLGGRRVSAAPFAVCVPARNECELLPKLLTSLAAQTSGWDHGRVFLVANNCTDDTVAVAAKWTSRLPLTIIDVAFASRRSACGVGTKACAGRRSGLAGREPIRRPSC